MAYRQSLMKYTEKYGVSRASRKYNKSRSYIYFWKQRWDGSVASLACQSRRPHSHPNQHTEAELKLIRDMRRRNPTLGMVELWHRLRQRGYTRRPESLFRIMRKMGMFPPEKPKKTYKPKPYEQMTYPGQRVQVDVKVVPRACIADPELRLFQYTAIDEFTRLRFLAAYPEQSTYSSADFLRKLTAWYARRGIKVECVQTDNGFEFTNRFSGSKRNLPTLFEKTAAELNIRHKLIRPYTPRHNGKVERSHREDQKRFYSCRSFYSLDDFAKQLAVHNRRSNNLPMRPLRWMSPAQVTAQYVWQTYIQIFVLPGGHARPGSGNLVREDGVLYAFLHTAGIPFIRQFFTDLDGLQPLIDPLTAVTLLEIGFQSAVNGQLRVDGLLDTLSTDLCQPQLERFCLRGRNRLDDSEKLLGIGYISQSFFAIRSGHFQLVTSCNRFISLILQAFLRYLPVVTSCLIIWLISQHSYHINDGKVPFFLFLIPCGSNTLVFEQLDIIVLCQLNHLVLS